ncbi:hypothetical protein MKW94_029827 [Papaver nudicaule]|uniref:KIB1-4 beta-propeller domain-containing protein n=1 Tax=Papaver nudicaule TaxID=74823 RepID=A0AA41V779_PAPNU|nr:hypothetical protein [Papaver nudicaule]
MSSNNSDGGNKAKAVEKSSLAISPIRTGTSINSDDDKEDVLIEDILWFLSRYLSPLDYIHLRAVRSDYRSVFPVVNWRKFCSPRSLQSTVLSPWLVFAKDNASVYSFINPVHNDENYLTRIPELLKGSTIRFSKGGWLLMSKGNHSVFFYNPFTKAIIKLPDLPDDRTYRFRGISFSSLPTSSNCTVFAISDWMADSACITFINCGNKMWTSDIFDNVFLLPNRTNMGFEPSLNSPIFYNGAFYCLDLNGNLGVFTVENDIKWEILSMVPRPNCGFIYKSYLVEVEGKLLAVLLGHYGKWVRIFRLDMSEMVWVEVEHLGRHLLFVSNTSCISTIAPSRMVNRIYFPRLQNGGILFYSLDSGKYHSLKSENHRTDYCNSKDNLRCSWIEPNWLQTTQPNIAWS